MKTPTPELLAQVKDLERQYLDTMQAGMLVSLRSGLQPILLTEGLPPGGVVVLVSSEVADTLNDLQTEARLIVGYDPSVAAAAADIVSKAKGGA